jgi:hypothetical protein
MARLTGLAAKVIKNRYKAVSLSKGYAFFESGDYNVNIIGVRNMSGDAKHFDDFLDVVYKISGEWVCDSYPITTEPGPNILRRPINSKGTAILVPGQYRGVYQIATHGGKSRYTALCQRKGNVKVWRDDNRDTVADYDGVEDEGMFGINIHKHSGPDTRKNTGGVSAGCQVFQSSKDFYEFMDTCDAARDRYENSFTYTLIEEKELTAGC